jgi:hypothetical protein
VVEVVEPVLEVLLELLLELEELLELLLVGVLNRLRAVVSELELDPVEPVEPDAVLELLLVVDPVEEELEELLVAPALLLLPGPRRLPRSRGASSEA